MVSGRAPSVLLLTEDTGGSSFAVLRALIEKMFYLLEPMSDVRRVRFDPADEKARAAMGWNAWKEHGPRGDRVRVDLRQAIATRLLHKDGLGFVLVHVDGDRRWADSKGGTRADNIEQFKKLVLPGIASLLAAKGQTEKIHRLVMVVPFWCMEAWLYQNVAEALRIYEKHHPDAREDIELFAKTWRVDPGALDEVEYPKKRVRIQDRHNLQLATERFPAERAHRAGKSFALVVETLRCCPGLSEALAELRFPAPA